MKIIGIASGSSGNSYVITSDEGKDPMLIEAGLPPQKLKEELWDRDISLSDINYCLISHEHQDHLKAASHLTKRGIKVLLPKASDKRYKKFFNRQDMVGYIENRGLILDNYFVVPLSLKHDDVPINGYYIQYLPTQEIIFYATDTMYIKYKFNSKINYFMIEVNYQEKYLEESVKAGTMVRENKRRIMRSHMGLDTAIKFLKSLDLEKTKGIYVIHHSERNSNPDEIKETIQEETGLPVYIL